MSTPNPRNSPSKYSNPYYGQQKRWEDDPQLYADRARTTIDAIPRPRPGTDDITKLLERHSRAVLESLAITAPEQARVQRRIKAHKTAVDRAAQQTIRPNEDDEVAVDSSFDPTGAFNRNPDPVGGESSGSSGDSGGSGSGPTQRSRKRKPGFDDTKSDLGANALYDGLIKQPAKKQKLNNNFQAQVPVDLPTLNPQPIRLNYEPHPLEDQSDEWFMGMFRKLYSQAEKFVVQFYGIHDLDRGAFYNPWGCDHSPEFIAWAEGIAEPDPAVGGWDNILNNTEQRQWFIMGLIMSIIQKKIFEVDLFGANEQEQALLTGLDQALFLREGFSRQALRSETVRTIIGRAPVTQNFYQKVAELTAQISLLLNPLTNYLYSQAPPDNLKSPDRFDLYQALHSLISNAAYLHIAVRLSPTIFYFVPLSPGQTYDPDDHLNFSQRAYTNSKVTIVDEYKKLKKAHDRLMAPKDAAVKAMKNAQRENTTEGRKSQADRDAAAANAPPNPGNTHRALVGIASWPVVTRFKPGGDADDKIPSKVAYLPDKDGFRIFQICKGGGVFYYGRERTGSVAAPERDRLRLRYWVRQKRGVAAKSKGGVVTTIAGWATLLGLAGVGYVLKEKGLDEVVNLVAGTVSALVK